MMALTNFSVLLLLNLNVVPERKSEWENMYYVAWLDMLMGGIRGLQFYNPETKVWGQAHVLASFAILSVVREYDPTLIKFEFTEKDGREYFYVNLDRSKLKTSAFAALSAFLRKLHIYKVKDHC